MTAGTEDVATGQRAAGDVAGDMAGDGAGRTPYMNTAEVADYLRLKERKIYDLVRQQKIPCTRVGGRWLFPKDRIDAWLAGHPAALGTAALGTAALGTAGLGSSGLGSAGSGPAAGAAAGAPPPVIAGSHDPLLDWCVAGSGCRLALAGGGSRDGLARFAAGEAVAAAVHIAEPEGWNVETVRSALPQRDIVVIGFAVREQGLIVPPGNPRRLGGVADLIGTGARMALRQAGSGSALLLERLLADAGVRADEVAVALRDLRTETEIGMAVLQGRADAGLAVRSAATQLRLDFVPLARERFDLVVRRRDYFEPPFQALLAFAGSTAARAHAAELGGYDLEELGRVRFNAP